MNRQSNAQNWLTCSHHELSNTTYIIINFLVRLPYSLNRPRIRAFIRDDKIIWKKLHDSFNVIKTEIRIITMKRIHENLNFKRVFVQLYSKHKQKYSSHQQTYQIIEVFASGNTSLPNGTCIKMVKNNNNKPYLTKNNK